MTHAVTIQCPDVGENDFDQYELPVKATICDTNIHSIKYHSQQNTKKQHSYVQDVSVWRILVYPVQHYWC